MNSMHVATDVRLKETGPGRDQDPLATIHIRTVSIPLYATDKMQRVQKNKHLNLWLFQKDVTTVGKWGTFGGTVEKGEGGQDRGPSLTILSLKARSTGPTLESRDDVFDEKCK